MSEVKHTPGPWKIDPILIKVIDGGQCPAYIRNESDVIIADMNFNIPAGIGSEACTANAKLIASAPDLLAALQAAVKLSDDRLEANQPRTPECQAVYDMCQAAIAKATT